MGDTVKLSRVYVCRNEVVVKNSASTHIHRDFIGNQIKEYVCDNELKPYLSQTSLEEVIKERIEYIYSMIVKNRNNNLADQYDSAAHELESILNAVRE